jgi:lipopolysaccharide/colanic/teichoic acid biosynthesis glycosyltransferase
MEDKKVDFYIRLGKRILDLLIATLLSIFLSPFLLVVAILVRLDSPGPVFFDQRRAGKDGRIFTAYKFRTMTHQARLPNREILLDDPEVTRIGYWLRRLKIDELPQLHNVVRGDMSLVGPRPALANQLLEYNGETQKRLLVRPGLTGLAQVNGNIYLSWPDRWKYDVWYVENISFFLDLKIMLRTVAVLLAGEDRLLRSPSLFIERDQDAMD